VKLNQDVKKLKADHIAALADVQGKQTTLQLQHSAEKSRADAAEKKVKELEHELKEAKTGKKDANKQMEKIWAEMQSMNGKRKARVRWREGWRRSGRWK
jgi:chromosome segregation ATPase